MKVGFIGLGRMGQPIAHNILRAGHELFVHDIREEACAPLIEQGGEKRKDPRNVAEAADVIVTSLPGPKEVEAVMVGNDGLIEGVRKNSIVIDTSTIGPTLSRSSLLDFTKMGSLTWTRRLPAGASARFQERWRSWWEALRMHSSACVRC